MTSEDLNSEDNPFSPSDSAPEGALDDVQQAVESLREQLAQVIVGQDEVIDQLLLSLLSSSCPRTLGRSTSEQSHRSHTSMSSPVLCSVCATALAKHRRSVTGPRASLGP